jgi:archaellum biogenesis protein FlaJ (TadC family)
MNKLHYLIGYMALILAESSFAQEKPSITIEQALGNAARPANKIRTLGHEWVWELEQAGVYNRKLPKQYRVGVPLMRFGDAGPQLVATYASPAGNNDRKMMLLMHIPFD